MVILPSVPCVSAYTCSVFFHIQIRLQLTNFVRKLLEISGGSSVEDVSKYVSLPLCVAFLHFINIKCELSTSFTGSITSLQFLIRDN